MDISVRSRHSISWEFKIWTLVEIKWILIPRIQRERVRFILICNTVVTNYDALEKLLDYGITAGLRYKAQEHPLLIVEEPYQSLDQRLKLAEILFEKLEFPAIYFMKSAPCIG